MSQKQIKHNFKHLLDRCEGSTVDLKLAAARAMGVSMDIIHKLYAGRQASMKLHQATPFIEFVNQKLPQGVPKIGMTDLVRSSESESV